MRFLVREAIEDDYQQLGQLFAEVDALHSETLPHMFQKPSKPVRTKDFISQIIADEKATLFVAESNDHGGQVIGVVRVGMREAPDVAIFVPRQFGWISDIVVKKEWQRLGVGRLLTERAHQWVLDKGAIGVQLTVWEFNQGAIGFYEKLGYTTVSRMMWRSLESPSENKS